MVRDADHGPLPDGPPGDLSSLLSRAELGDRDVIDQLFGLVYPQIRTIARQRMAGGDAGMTINTTGLINESYIRMAGCRDLHFISASHFFATASRVMRNIIIDAARARHAAKRGCGLRALTLDSHQIAIEDQAEQLFEIDRQLRRLEVHDQRLARLIELRFFGGLSEPETAEALAVSLATVQRDWARARAWFRMHCVAQEGAGD